MNAPSPAAERASGSSFYSGMRILPRAEREAMFEIYRLPRGRRHRRRSRPARGAARHCSLARRYRRALCRRSRRSSWRARPGGAQFDLARRFSRRHRRHGDGRRRRYPRARSGDARSLLRPRRLRGRAALGAGVRHGARRRPCACPSSRPRAAAHQYPARPRRGCGARAGSICRARRCATPASSAPIRGRCWQIRCSVRPVPRSSKLAKAHFQEARAIMAQNPRRAVRAPRIMGEAYRLILDQLMARGFAPPRAPVHLPRVRILLIVLRNLF